MFKTITRFFRRPRAGAAGHVYYARLKTERGTFYKLGFTTKKTLVERMAYGGTGDENLIDQQFFFMYRDDAWDVEQTLRGSIDRYGQGSGVPLSVITMPNCLTKNCWNG